MYTIHYEIENKTIIKEFTLMIKTNIKNVFSKETLILIEPETANFKNIINLLHSFFKEYSLDIEDYVHIYNFSGYDENNWQCEMIKKKGLKRIN